MSVNARKAAEMLYARCNELLENHPAWKKRVLMMLLDQPSVKVLRGKTRWHVMFKLLVNPAVREYEPTVIYNSVVLVLLRGMATEKGLEIINSLNTQ